MMAGCATVGSNAAGIGTGATARSAPSASTVAAGSATSATATSQAGATITRTGPIWFRSLQMTSTTSGWAFYYAKNPDSSSVVVARLARTTDGGRTWTDVTPASALDMLLTPDAAQVLDPVNGDDAYLAVTGATEESNSAVNTTVVFATTDRGRTWTASAPLRAVSTASQVSFADPKHGFLMLGGDGGEMGEDQVWLYRTADGGKHWSLAAASPGEPGAAVTPPPDSGRIPTECDKHGLNFPTATTGWITSTCNDGLAHGLLVSNDSGASWSGQSLPLPATTGAGGACFVTGPQFVGGAGFVTVEPETSTPALLESRDLGQTWEQIALPAGLRYPQINFFSPTQGVLVAGESQGAFQSTFYTTTNGGQTWTPVPQGTNFTKIGATIDFTSTQDGLAWTTGENGDPTQATSIYQTTNSGRTWHAFTPHLLS